MQKRKFSQKGLKELVAESATFSYFFGNDNEFFAEVILGMDESRQREIFEILEAEKEKMAAIDQKYDKQQTALIVAEIAKVKTCSRRLKLEVRKSKERIQSKHEQVAQESLLNEL